MTCEACAADTSPSHTEVPAEGVDSYITLVMRNDEVPENALERETYEFCSVRCLRMFAPAEVLEA